jgi:F0F1-type ATP synthase membrane subunit b/b'
MSRKKSSSVSKKDSPSAVKAPVCSIDRDKKIMNSIANVSILMMSIMMGAFSELMVNMTGAVASGMAGAVGGEEAEAKVKEEVEQKLPEANEKMKTMVSDIRKDIYVQFEQKRKEIEPFLSDSVFDVGPRIIEKYDFSLPKLTEELDDASLAQYSKLIMTEDPKFGEMFKALTEWMNNLPQPPKSPKQ